MITAEQARSKTESATSGPAIQPYLDNIEKRITEAAEAGYKAITQPFAGPEEKPASHIVEAIRKVIEDNGFTWEHFTGDQREPADEITISWAKKT